MEASSKRSRWRLHLVPQQGWQSRRMAVALSILVNVVFAIFRIG
jgi:hypothetical protein